MAAPKPLDTEIIRTRAVHAWDIWKNALFFDNLSDAVADCSIVVGTTCRRGSRRKSVSMPPRTLARWFAGHSGLHQGTAAIVFGNEKNGLEDSELELCNFASHIPVSDVHPSLNLSHAVQVYAYELFLAFEQQRGCPSLVKGEWISMNQSEVSALVGSITGTLANLGFYKKPGREGQARFLQDLISRAGLTKSEGKYLEEIFSKAANMGART